MHCPRCQRESPDGLRFCAGCGAPVSLGREPQARPLDAPVDLDRRSRGGGAGAATEADLTEAELTRRLPPPLPAGSPAPARPPRGGELGPLPDPAASHWDLGAALGARDRTLAPIAPPPPGVDRTFAPIAPPPASPDRAEPILAPGAPAPDAAAPSPEHAPAHPSRPSPVPVAAGSGALLPDVPDADVEVLEIHVRPASPGRRLLSWAVDLAFLLGLFAAVLWFAGSLIQLEPPRPTDPLTARYVLELGVGALTVVLAFVYQTLCHALAGATLGKWVAGLRVVGADGRRPSLGRSAFRTLAGALSVALLGLGLLVALFTDSGRSLHDALARTWVVRAP